MSLSGALSSAISGLAAASRGAQLISSNLANATTEGYGARSLELEARQGAGGGVRIVSTVRQVNPALISELQLATAESASAEVMAEFSSRLEDWIGTPDSEDSLSAEMHRFEASLVAAASRPDQPGRLHDVAEHADGVARRLNNLERNVQGARGKADREISVAVEHINESLQSVKYLNGQITTGNIAKRDVSALMDQRQTVLNDLAGWIPFKQIERPNGSTALYSLGGIPLVDGLASNFAFERVNTVTAEMSVEGGQLSGLEVNGHHYADFSDSSLLRGGKLAALFELRDEKTVAVQAEIDAIARDLIERFEAVPIPGSVDSSGRGLFVDGVVTFDQADENGVSGRLKVNPSVLPEVGGDPARLRDGLSATVAGAAGDATLLNGFAEALRASRTVGSGSFEGVSLTVSDLTGSVSGRFGAARLKAEQTATFASTRAHETESMLLSEGVDSDDEMQKLLIIERSYAANAQVVKAIGDMMDTLMRAV